MLMVQDALSQRRVADAVGIYRSARDLWLEDGVFGTNGVAPEDEFLELRAVYFVDLKEVIFIFILFILFKFFFLIFLILHWIHF